jgi:hypothetical protein
MSSPEVYFEWPTAFAWFDYFRDDLSIEYQIGWIYSRRNALASHALGFTFISMPTLPNARRQGREMYFRHYFAFGPLI